MGRKPKQIHVFLYRKNNDGNYEYALFQRTEDERYWQGICGGLEGNESLEEGAYREIREEAGIKNPEKTRLQKLDSISSLPGYLFEEYESWGKDIFVVPMHYFAMYYDGEITISEEHNGFKWCTFEEGYDLIYFHEQKTALWEINERLK